ncbi:MAG: protein kinase, partial [Chloroflexota bacterium]
MALTKGQRLGPYEIESVAGAGGMGEVYRALDTRLERTVAIKVLPQGVAMSGDARARFEREARTISSLNHPNICTLHDVGQEGVIDYLVMEFLEGETLEERLHRSKMDLAEALTVGIQVAGALEAAHHKGLVHRDLKPGNIFLTKDGAKLMDFGLAKPHNNVVTGMDDNTRTMGVTGAGAIVGTLQYMSPEQLEGKEADHRSDIFAFGAMLYEMVTHNRAFTGESKASLIGSIIKDQPRSISEMIPTSPPALERLIKKCLQKDPDKRWQSAADLKDELEWIASAGSQAGVPTPVAVRRRLQFRLAWVVAAVALCAVAVMTAFLLSDESPVETTARFMLPQLEGTTGIEWPRLSPDGSKIAFLAADTSGVNRIWVRPLNSVDAYVLAGTENAWRPFWSPDSKHLAFFANKRLKRVAASGGPVQTLCETTGEDGSWGKTGVIVFDGNADINPGGLMAVDASGGTPRVLTTRDSTQNESFHCYPWFLPDGKHFLYQIPVRWSSRSATWAVKVGSIESSESRQLMTANSRVEYCEPGYLLYVKGGTLLAHPFDSDDLRFTGEPVALASDVARQWEMGADFAATSDTKGQHAVVGRG